MWQRLKRSLRVRIEGRNVTFTLDATILKDDPFAQLSGNINRFSFCSSFFTVNEKLILLLFAKFGDISDTSPHWPCNAMTGNRRRSMPPGEREGESERGSGGRNSWLEWRKCQHFDTNSWGASKMTNGPTGWALNLTSLSFLTAHLLILDSKSEGRTLKYKPLKVKYHRGDYLIPLTLLLPSCTTGSFYILKVP